MIAAATPLNKQFGIVFVPDARCRLCFVFTLFFLEITFSVELGKL